MSFILSGESPLDNPLKGWAAYSNPGDTHSLPVSMAYFYRSWRELEPKPGQYAFAAWERLWDNPSARGKHVVLRIYLDYPKLPPGVPDWVIKRGVKMTPYREEGGGVSPDYNDPNLLAPLLDFIAAFGARYNPNPRVAFIALGTLGFWGEWHTYPRNELFAALATQERVVDAYRRAFPDKILLARNPGLAATGRASWLGYHDDFFPDDTDGSEDWQFLPSMRKAGRDENWKQAAIGAEMVPGKAAEYLGPRWKRTQAMVKASHLSWIGPYCPALKPELSPEQIARANAMVRQMGYSFRLTKIEAGSRGKCSPISIRLSGINEGIAPFYYPWSLEFAALSLKENKILQIQKAETVDIRRWLPGPFTAEAELMLPASFAGVVRLAVGIRDPWTKQPAIRFANHLDIVDGWTILKPVMLLN